MASVITPNWTDPATDIVALAVLARNALTRGTIDLRQKPGAFIYVRVGRGGTTGLTNGVEVRVNRTLSNNTIKHPVSFVPLGPGLTAVAQSTTISGANVNAGDFTLNVGSTTNWAQGDYGLIQDAGGGVTRAEWFRVARVTDATHLLLDAAVQFAHTTAQADTVRNKADVYPPIWLPGGCVYEVIFDYGDDAAGESVTVECKAQTYDSDTAT